METHPPGSGFSDCLVRCNGLDEVGFRQWVFRPGMLVGSVEAWWGEGGVRVRPHEGLDVCYYRDTHGRVHGLNGAIRVPVMYDGDVAAIMNDFLGRSVFVRHAIHDSEGWRLYTIYGHTALCDGVRVGRTLEEGEVFATIAEPLGGKTGAPAHLHLSVAWVPQSVSGETLDWETIADPRRVRLVDPLQVAFFEYAVLRDTA